MQHTSSSKYTAGIALKTLLAVAMASKITLASRPAEMCRSPAGDWGSNPMDNSHISTFYISHICLIIISIIGHYYYIELMLLVIMSYYEFSLNSFATMDTALN